MSSLFFNCCLKSKLRPKTLHCNGPPVAHFPLWCRLNNGSHLGIHHSRASLWHNWSLGCLIVIVPGVCLCRRLLQSDEGCQSNDIGNVLIWTKGFEPALRLCLMQKLTKEIIYHHFCFSCLLLILSKFINKLKKKTYTLSSSSS